MNLIEGTQILKRIGATNIQPIRLGLGFAVPFEIGKQAWLLNTIIEDFDGHHADTMDIDETTPTNWYYAHIVYTESSIMKNPMWDTLPYPEDAPQKGIQDKNPLVVVNTILSYYEEQTE